MVSAPARVEAPQVTPALGGLLAVADIREASDPHVAMGIEYLSWLCGTASAGPGLCEYAPGVSFDETKQFSGPEVVQGAPFVVYSGVVCDLFGAPYAQQVRDRLAGGEERAVSRAFYETIVANTPPTPIVTGVDIVAAVAALEQYAAVNFGGMPILHMNRATATYALAEDVVEGRLDGALMTKQGTPVANAPGYPDGVVFVTGPVHLWRTPVRVHDVPDPQANLHYALAERVYVAATDCILALARFVPGAGGGGTPGPAGPSAFDIAVEHGFVGTEAEWLDSLHADASVIADLKVDRLGDVTGLWLGTQAEYDAISPKDPAVVYAVVQ